ncbi:hypothetical protein MJO29_005634 [Puccinia striiformis f. sp. tritici]|nr:hypothetical protein MJO29_005634 [Puccinia striiformis f. sp. tritici]
MAIHRVLSEDKFHGLKPTADGSWAAARLKRVDEGCPEMVDRKLRGLLNKLTAQNFESISDQIVQWVNKSEKDEDGKIVRQLVSLIIEQLTGPGLWPELYAKLCGRLKTRISPEISDRKVVDDRGHQVRGAALFRKYLVDRCQNDYEEGWSKRDDPRTQATEDGVYGTAHEAANKKTHTVAKAGCQDAFTEETDVLSDEFYAIQKAKRQYLALTRFIGELFKLDMLTERTMHAMIKPCLTNLVHCAEEDLETLCCLMMTVGKILDHEKGISHMNVYFARMETICTSPHLSSRIRFMVKDVIEARANKWAKREVGAIAKCEEKSPASTPDAISKGPLCPPKPDGNKANLTHLTNKQKQALLQCILEQQRAGFRKKGWNLQEEGWTNVAENMNNKFNMEYRFRCYKARAHILRLTYVNIQFLRAREGFEWDDLEHKLVADEAAWECIFEETEPDKRSHYQRLRRGRVEWYNLADQVFGEASTTEQLVQLPENLEAKRKTKVLSAWGDDQSPQEETISLGLNDQPKDEEIDSLEWGSQSRNVEILPSEWSDHKINTPPFTSASGWECQSPQVKNDSIEERVGSVAETDLEPAPRQHINPTAAPQEANVTQLTKKQKMALLQYVLQQRLKLQASELSIYGWAQVVETMNEKFGTEFNLKSLQGGLSKLHQNYLDIEFLRNVEGFEWNQLKRRLIADSATWERIIEKYPHKSEDYGAIRLRRIDWYDLAVQIYGQTSATDQNVRPPAKLKAKGKEIVGSGWGNVGWDDVQPQEEEVISSSSNDQPKDEQIGPSEWGNQSKNVDIISSDWSDLAIKTPPLTPSSRVGCRSPLPESESTRAKVETIAETQPESTPKGNSNPTVVLQSYEGISPNPIHEAITLMAPMFLNELTALEYVKFIQVLESESNARVFLSLASSTNATICKTWLTEKLRLFP